MKGKIVVMGGRGVGKTALIEALGKQTYFDLVEMQEQCEARQIEAEKNFLEQRAIRAATILKSIEEEQQLTSGFLPTASNRQAKRQKTRKNKYGILKHPKK